MRIKQYIGALAFFFSVQAAQAAGSGAQADALARDLALLALILVASRLGALVEKWGQPAVLGELAMGIVLGNVYLLGYGGDHLWEGNTALAFMAELGVVVLLFQIGLETDLKSLLAVGGRALGVATIGVVAPFVLGTVVVAPWLLPQASQHELLFIGAALCATSVGITGRVFKDMNCLHLREAKIVLGAAVIDDVLGLIILAVVSALASAGSVNVATVALISVKALGFLVAAVWLGQRLAPVSARWFGQIQATVSMQLGVMLAFCLLWAYLAYWVGLAPIVGAFAAGLVFEEAHFSKYDTHTRYAHMEQLIAPLGYFLVPIFFVLTGASVKLETLADPQVLMVAAALSIVAVLGKLASGLAAGSVNKWLVGFAMVPRGEVGLIFAAVGKSLGVVDETVFSVIVVVVMVSTLLTPPMLVWLLRRSRTDVGT